MPPVILLAFANDRARGVRYLRNLPEELRQVRQALARAEQAGLCEVVERANATATEILDVFQDARYRDRVAILHYGGHANGYELLLESASGAPAIVHAGGLAAFLARQRGLQLVFLNACSTQPQVQGLLEAGVLGVVATAWAVDDRVAADFATRFYMGLGGGATIDSAYHEAAAAIQIQAGNSPRALYYYEESAEERWPWELTTRPGAESATGWNLPAAADDPLFGLPPLPPLDLPEHPFRHLAWFDRAHAPVFFGRGHAIRDLYMRVTALDGAPVLLFYGQSGVGKSSVLAAGLQPRLEAEHEICYARRSRQAGLLGTLLAALRSGTGSSAAGKAGSESVIGATQQWLAVEEQCGRPVVVILDQVEEVYTRPQEAGPDKEIEVFLADLQALFTQPAQRPRGKLILSFRKEWLAEVEARLSEAQLPRARVFLERLDRAGIMEAVAGVARVRRLQAHYGLTVEETLPGLIADDLLEDRDSPIAPTVQILLTKMWEEARRLAYSAPRFDLALYQHLKRQGILLKDFLDQQLAALYQERAEVVESGLALDLLAFHTTSQGTAEQRDVLVLSQNYAHRADILAWLVQQLKNLYLLVDPLQDQPRAVAVSRLAHDALAPLVREQYEKSDKPGQRARRILENRAVEWSDGRQGTPLDKRDLATVEQGKAGMRVWTPAEERLVVASLQARARQQARQHVLVTATACTIVLIIVLGLYGWWQRTQAVAEARRNLSLAHASESLLERDRHHPERALLAAIRAYQPGAPLQAPLVSRSLHGVLSEMLPARTLFGHSDEITGMAWSRDGRYLLTVAHALGDSRGRIWDVSTGEIVRILEGASAGDTPIEVAWSPDGQRVYTLSVRGMIQSWDTRTGEHETQRTLDEYGGANEFVWAAAWSPDLERVLTGSNDGTLYLWEVRSGELIRRMPGHTQLVNAIAWRPDGEEAISVSEDGTTRLWEIGTGSTVENVLVPSPGVGLQSVRWSANGQDVLLAGSDRVIVWNRATGSEVTLLLVPSVVWDLEWSPEGGQAVVVSGEEGTVGLRDARTGSLIDVLEEQMGIVEVSWSPDGRWIAIGDRQGVIQVWPVAAPRTNILARQATMVAWNPDSTRVAIGHEDGTVLIRNVLTQEEQRLSEHGAAITGLAWEPRGAYILTGSRDGTALVWDMTTGEVRARLEGFGVAVDSVAWSPDGARVATGVSDGVVRVWGSEAWTVQHTLLAHGDPVMRLLWKPDSKQLLSDPEYGQPRVWDVETGKELFTVSGEEPRGSLAIAWHPNDQDLMIGYRGGGFLQEGPGLLSVLDGATGAELYNIPVHGVSVQSVEPSADGQQVLTVGYDGAGFGSRVRLWNPSGWTERITFEGIALEGTPIGEWSPDGRKLLSLGNDGVVYVWTTSDGYAYARLVELACTLFSEDQLDSELTSWRGCNTELAQIGADLAAFHALAGE